MKRKVTVDVCPRCKGEHVDLVHAPLTRGSGPWTHWALCPVLAEPILWMSKPMTLWGLLRSLETWVRVSYLPVRGEKP
jgi:hypothetical protein